MRSLFFEYADRYLNERTRAILIARSCGARCSIIGAAFGITRARVSQIAQIAIAKIAAQRLHSRNAPIRHVFTVRWRG